MRMGVLGDLEACSVNGCGISTYETVDTIGLISWLGNWLDNHFVSDGGSGRKVNTITSSHNFLAGAHVEALSLVSDAKVASFSRLSLEQQLLRRDVNNRLWKRSQLSFLIPCLSD